MQIKVYNYIALSRQLMCYQILMAGLLMFSLAGAIVRPSDSIAAPTGAAAKETEDKDSISPVNLKGKIVVYKFKISNGTPWRNGNRGSWVIYDIVNGQNVVIKQTTLHVNQWSGYAKWWDHEVIASRACKKGKQGGEDLSSCIVGNRNLVKIPDGESVYSYLYEFSWNENGKVQSAATAIDPERKPDNIRSME